jgi:hypothetical protein
MSAIMSAKPWSIIDRLSAISGWRAAVATLKYQDSTATSYSINVSEDDGRCAIETVVTIPSRRIRSASGQVRQFEQRGYSRLNHRDFIALSKSLSARQLSGELSAIVPLRAPRALRPKRKALEVATVVHWVRAVAPEFKPSEVRFEATSRLRVASVTFSVGYSLNIVLDREVTAFRAPFTSDVWLHVPRNLNEGAAAKLRTSGAYAEIAKELRRLNMSGSWVARENTHSLVGHFQSADWDLAGALRHFRKLATMHTHIEAMQRRVAASLRAADARRESRSTQRKT